MLSRRLSTYLATCVVPLLVAGVVSAQDANSDEDELSLLAPSVQLRPLAIPDKYDFPELTEIDNIEPVGYSVSSIDVGSMSNFRRAFFLDERAFVLQFPGSGRYYLGVLNAPSSFTGRCARRPEAVGKKGGSYILSCGNKGMRVAKFYLLEDTEQLDEITERLQQ